MRAAHIWFWANFGWLIGMAIGFAPLIFLWRWWERDDRAMRAHMRQHPEGPQFAWPDKRTVRLRWMIAIVAIVLGFAIAEVILPPYAWPTDNYE